MVGELMQEEMGGFMGQQAKHLRSVMLRMEDMFLFWTS